MAKFRFDPDSLGRAQAKLNEYGAKSVKRLTFALQNWAGRFMDCVDVTRVTAYGDPNAAAREILDRLGATYHSAWGGFARF